MNRMPFFVIVLIKPPGNAGGLLLLYLLTEIVTLFPETETFAKSCVSTTGVTALLSIVILLKAVEKLL